MVFTALLVNIGAFMNYYAHPTAVIDPGATIGSGTKIWHFTHIMPGAVVGEDCIIGQNVMIGDGVILGRKVKVQNNVSLYTGVICEDAVFLGPSVVFTNVINPRSLIPRKDQFRPTLVRKGATIGANATIICGNTIGEYAFIGAGAVLTRSAPPYSLFLGNPARHTGWVSEYGHRLLFDANGRGRCPESGETYRLQDNQLIKIAAHV
jgi:UDP-2-acetamido-3-amino-2,3-dideoxy-glucuronate N-acetyltransferase